jgi:hypothetical protein
MRTVLIVSDNIVRNLSTMGIQALITQYALCSGRVAFVARKQCRTHYQATTGTKETPATNVVLQFDTGALKINKELGKYFSKNGEIIESKDATVSRRYRRHRLVTEGGQRHRATYSQESSIEIRGNFVPPDRVRRLSPHIDRFRKSATADFRHFGRRWIVERGKPCRNHQLSRRQGPRAGLRPSNAEAPHGPHPERLLLHRRLASLAMYAATTPPPPQYVNARVRMRRR